MSQRRVDAERVGRFVAAALVMAFVGALGLFVAALCTVVLASVATAVLWDAPLSGPREQIVSTVALGAGTALTVVGYLVWTDRSLSFLDVEWPSLRDVGWTLAGIVTLFAALFAIQYAFDVLGIPLTEHSTSEAAKSNPALLLPLIPLSLLVIGPGEELLYRNVIQKALYDSAPRWVAVLTASIIFALVHIPAYSTGDSTEALLAALSIIFTLSIVLGVVYERTQNIVVPALIHGGYNAISFGISYVEYTTNLVALHFF